MLYLQILLKMKTNKFGEIILSESDLCDFIMKGHNLLELNNPNVASNIDILGISSIVEQSLNWQPESDLDCSVAEFDWTRQHHWHMPEEYKNLDIAEHILSICTTQAELQRCGQELLLYKDKDLFDLLRYLKYLVDTMRNNQLIWGVGRGSSVASYVLYKLGVHRIDSMYYDLDPREFLR